MKATDLLTNNEHVMLVEPDVERDAPLGVVWLDGEVGRATLRLMGMPDAENKPATLEEERERVQGFISDEEHLNWMIAYDRQVVGSVWVDLQATDELPSPSVHIMVGDQAMRRGKGVGSASLQAVLGYLQQTGVDTIYSRHVMDNEGSNVLLHGLGFTNLGEPYTNNDRLEFQNLVLKSGADE